MAALQALAKASLKSKTMSSSAAQHLLQQATLQAERVFQGQAIPGCLGADTSDVDAQLAWQQFMPLLDTTLSAPARSCLQADESRAADGTSQSREDPMLDLGTELARALACLRLYFALECGGTREKIGTREKVCYSLSVRAGPTASSESQQTHMRLRAASACTETKTAAGSILNFPFTAQHAVNARTESMRQICRAKSIQVHLLVAAAGL